MAICVYLYKLIVLCSLSSIACTEVSLIVCYAKLLPFTSGVFLSRFILELTHIVLLQLYYRAVKE